MDDACTHLDWRPLRVPFGGAFVCCSRADERRLAEQRAHELQARGRSAITRTARH